MLYQGRVKGWARWSRVRLHDLGHVPCHLSAVGVYSQPSNVLESRRAPRWTPGWWPWLLVSGQVLALGLGLPSEPMLCPSSTSSFLPSSLGFCCPQSLWLKRAAFLSGSAPQRVYHPTQRQGCGSISISWGAAMLLEPCGGGALPSPRRVLPGEQSTCLPIDL